MDKCEKKRRERELLRDRRRALPASEREAASRALCRRISHSALYRDSGVILAYFPVGEEPDLRPLWERALSDGKTLAFPRCEGKEMRFYTVSALSELVPDRFSIPAPKASCPPLSDVRGALVIVPALSADARGTRVGYGGGFYDRFLAENRQSVTLCCVYEALFSEGLVREDHDVPMQFVFTEEREVKCYDA